MAVQRIDHPLVQHKITLMRDKMTGPRSSGSWLQRPQC